MAVVSASCAGLRVFEVPSWVTNCVTGSRLDVGQLAASCYVLLSS